MTMKTDNDGARILVISPNWIGDAVMAQPLLQQIKEHYPTRPIDVLAPTWVAPVWEAMREVASVMETPFRHGALQLGERRKFARMLQQKGYVEAYVLPNTLKYALIPWMAGIPRRIGYKGEMRYGLINVMHHNNPAAPRPMTQFYAALADAPTRSLPRPPVLPRPVLSVSEDSAAQVMWRMKIAPDEPYIVFAPGAEYGPAKRWPTARFAELAAMIQRAYPSVTILLLGSPKDKEVGDEIVAAAPAVRNLAGTTTLNDAIALIARAQAVVSNDSGLMHIAAALERPLVAVYGPTDPRHTPPLSDLAKILWLKLECAPCQKRECPLGHHNCMRGISAEMIWEPLHAMIQLRDDQGMPCR